jgi:hypothetical protein
MTNRGRSVIVCSSPGLLTPLERHLQVLLVARKLSGRLPADDDGHKQPADLASVEVEGNGEPRPGTVVERYQASSILELCQRQAGKSPAVGENVDLDDPPPPDREAEQRNWTSTRRR